MRLPRVRFTVMGMMVAVAITGVGLGCVDLSLRCRRYRMLASEYEGRIWKRSAHIQFATEDMRSERHNKELLKSTIEEDARASEYLDRLMRKYRVAASRPWTFVEPDPPSRSGSGRARDGIISFVGSGVRAVFGRQTWPARRTLRNWRMEVGGFLDQMEALSEHDGGRTSAELRARISKLRSRLAGLLGDE